MNQLYLHDTMTREKRLFEPADPKRVTMYVCGPTVYNYAHIGNARPVVAFDVLFRLLRHLYGEDAVLYAANVTDVDDKINLKAAEEGVPISVITDRYLDAYHADMSVLGALRPTLEPRATGHIGAIIATIERLVLANSAYAAEGHVLFNTQAFADYGQLSGRSLDDMIAGARVEVAPYKQHPADFVLWKPSKPGEPVWDSPWGPGRPGWHIECSAMIAEALGAPIDIHGGGNDLIFPHHENEMAQGLCADHIPVFSRYWLHNGFVTMESEKMSKSLGNVVLVHDLVTRHPGEALRWTLMSAHYRAPLQWSEEAIEQSRRSLDRLYKLLQDIKTLSAQLGVQLPAPGTETTDSHLTDSGFWPALMDDLNTPQAMRGLFALADEIRSQLLMPADKRDWQAIADQRSALLKAANLIGVLLVDPDAWFQGGADVALKARIDELIAARIEARRSKDWATADTIRAELTALNVEVMDGADGATWRFRETVAEPD